jgi:hypothetical protein
MSGLKMQRLMFAGVACAALVTSACNEKGLPGKNRPFAEAANREWRYPLYEAIPAQSKIYQLADRTWQISGATQWIPMNMLQSVSSFDGAAVYALKSDAAPYDQLYMAGENGRVTVVNSIN